MKHNYKNIFSVLLLLLAFNWSSVSAQNNLVNSPYWKCLSTSLSGQSSAAIRSDGTLWVWGHNASGQLGLGVTGNVLIPQKLIINKSIYSDAQDNDWAYVSQGATFIHAIKTDGSLWTAGGASNNGVLGNGSTSGQTSLVRVGTDNDWRYVSCGVLSSSAIKTDGSIWSWGAAASGQLGLGASVTTAQISPQRVSSESWKTVSSGLTYTIAIKGDGTLWGWGLNTTGQLGLGTDVTNKNVPTQISADTDWAYASASTTINSMAIKTNGAIYSWGRQTANGQLGNGSNNTTVTTPTLVPGTTSNFVKVMGGSQNFLALKADGTLWVTGSNAYGENGNGVTGGSTSFISAAGGSNAWDAVSYGFRTVLGVKNDGTVWGWAGNGNGQLGDNTNTDSPIPVRVKLEPLVQFNEVTTASFTGVNWSDANWADYDNDGFKDILITGSTTVGAASNTQLYKNNGDGTFTSVSHPFKNASNTSRVAWGDYNNDGWIDVIICGIDNNSANRFTTLYKNNGNGTFSEVTGTPFKNIYSGSLTWFDGDNDGFLDVILVGSGDTGTSVYKNNGDGTFTDLGSTVSSVFATLPSGNIAATDFDGDGLTDLLFTGNLAPSTATTKLYKNRGNFVFEEVNAGFAGAYSGEAQWVDYNNDGLPDVSIVGRTGTTQIAKLYKNNGNGTFEEVAIPFAGVRNSAKIKWFDYNADGFSDAMIMGTQENSTSTGSTIIYKNNGNGTFTKIEDASASFPKLMYGSIAIADFNNDGSPDILLSGREPENSDAIITKLYKNNWAGSTNNNIPTTLKAELNTSTNIKFDWANTAGATKYYLRIGTIAGAGDVVNGLNPVTTSTGNPLAGTFTINKALTNGTTYYWSVRTENASLNLSNWAPEQTFTVDLSTLPVTLVSFEAKKEDNRVKLQWVTSAEKDNNRFEVERSADGKNFSLLTTETARNTAATYTVYDRNPLAGVNYYRLKQIDNDGELSDLGVKVINFNISENAAIATWPNPVVNQTLNVDFGKAKGKALKLKVADITGRIVYEQSLQATQTQDTYSLILPTALKAGYYLLNINGSDISYSNKIIIR